jgi:hypothetical protein
MGLCPDGALNTAAWQMIRDLVGAGPALNETAWVNLRGNIHLLRASDATEEAGYGGDSWVTFRRA